MIIFLAVSFMIILVDTLYFGWRLKATQKPAPPQKSAECLRLKEGQTIIGVSDHIQAMCFYVRMEDDKIIKNVED